MEQGRLEPLHVIVDLSRLNFGTRAGVPDKRQTSFLCGDKQTRGNTRRRVYPIMCYCQKTNGSTRERLLSGGQLGYRRYTDSIPEKLRRNLIWNPSPSPSPRTRTRTALHFKAKKLEMHAAPVPNWEVIRGPFFPFSWNRDLLLLLFPSSPLLSLHHQMNACPRPCIPCHMLKINVVRSSW